MEGNVQTAFLNKTKYESCKRKKKWINLSKSKFINSVSQEITAKAKSWKNILTMYIEGVMISKVHKGFL